MDARLEGGPMDGDTGRLLTKRPPRVIFAVRCGADFDDDPPRCTVADPRERFKRGERCKHEGVHWWTRRALAHTDAIANRAAVERYRLARIEAGAAVYIYAEASVADGHLAVREQEPVTA